MLASLVLVLLLYIHCTCGPALSYAYHTYPASDDGNAITHQTKNATTHKPNNRPYKFPMFAQSHHHYEIFRFER